MKKFLRLFLLLPFAVNAQVDRDITGDYAGYIDLKTARLKVVVHISEDDRKLSGTMDIPQQNATGLKLENMTLKQGLLSYQIPEVPGNASFTGYWKPEVDSISGTFSQSGMSLKMLTQKTEKNTGEKTKLSQFAKVQKIEAYIDSLLRKGKLAGCSVGIIQNGEIVMNRGFGYRDAENKIKCDQNTLFAIGSCTKAFTAAVLATLNDEGLFDWEKPIKHYVPYFGMKDRFADEQINGLDICTHRSGLPRHDMIWYGSGLSRKELVERIKYMEPNKPFRTTWQYNNFMFMTAGVVAEEITREKWEDLVQKRIFDPLGMKSSKVHFQDMTATENRSLGYREKKGKIEKMDYRNIDAMGPAGSIYSTSADMLQWVKMLLGKGKAGEKQLISENQVDFLLSPKMVMPAADKDFKQPCYALGWIVSQYKGKTYIEHGGNIDGFSSDVVLIPEEKIGIVVLTNKDGSPLSALIPLYITDKLLDFEEYDWYEEKIGVAKRMAEASDKIKKEKEAKKPKEKEKEKKPAVTATPFHPLKDYAGEYTDPAYGTVTISVEGQELKGHFNSLDMKVRYDKYETFIASLLDEELKIVFFTNTSGKVEWLQVQLETATGPITFYKKKPDYLHDPAYIAKISGEYALGPLTLTIAMDKNKLMSRLSDGQEYELVPSGENLFKLKEIEGFSMEMVFDEKGNCIKVITHQPNGDFEAIRKK